jgi:hypothetical protein
MRFSIAYVCGDVFPVNRMDGWEGRGVGEGGESVLEHKNKKESSLAFVSSLLLSIHEARGGTHLTQHSLHLLVLPLQPPKKSIQSLLSREQPKELKLTR